MMRSKRVMAILLLVICAFSIVSPSLSGNATSSAIPAMGVPVKLDVILAPSKVPAYDGTHYLVVVQLLDIHDKPALAPTDTVVTLTSSDPSVGTVTAAVTISSGRSSAEAYFYSTYKPGSTTIKASSPDLASGSAVMTTVGATPTKLVVQLNPWKLPNDDRTYYYPVVVLLQDDAGNPALADTSITVSLTSSDTSVGTVPLYLTINKGDNYGYTWFDTTTKAGQTTITASSPGLASGSDWFETGSGGSATKLSVSIRPYVVIANDRTYNYPIVVQLLDADNKPSIAASDVGITLTSSDAEVGTVPSPLTISAGQNYVSTWFDSTYNVGSTEITASSLGLTSGSMYMNTVGATPTKLVVLLAPPEVLAYGANYYYPVRVQLQDNAGNPALAPTDLSISLTSLDTSVGTVPASITISRGNTFSYAGFYSTYKVGSTTIRASLLGLTSGSAVMTTFGATPTTLVMWLNPAKLINNDWTYYNPVVIALQDDYGNPALAPTDIGITLSSSNSMVGTVPGSVTIPKGSNYVSTWFDTKTMAGQTTITASSLGLASASGVMTTVTGGVATKMLVTVSPAKLIATSTTYWSPVVVQLQDADGNPSIATKDIIITLKSSDTTIGSVESPGYISAGYNWADFYFTATYKPGSTTITAYSPGLPSDSEPIFTGRWYPQPPPFDLSDYPVPFVIGGVLNMTFVVGGTHPHGPFTWGAWTVDVLGGMGVASRLGHEAFKEINVVQAVDDDIADYDPGAGSVTIYWNQITTNTVASIGSGAVNIVSLYYNGTMPFKFVKKGWDVSIYSTLSNKSYDSGWGYDHAVVALIEEPHVGPVLIAYGIGGKGSQAASLILSNYDKYPQLLKGKAVIVKWQDLNGDNMPDLGDQYTLIEWAP